MRDRLRRFADSLPARSFGRPLGRSVGLVAIVSLSVLSSRTVARAQSYSLTTLATFGSNQGQIQGALALDEQGNLFGVTGAGGSGNGTVFEIAAGTTGDSTIAAFNGTNGLAPQGGIAIDSTGNLFGTTAAGGQYNSGTVFEIAKGSTTITSLGSFDGDNGSGPESAVMFDASGNLFGTSFGSIDNIPGSVFEVAHGSTTITAIATFTSGNRDMDGMFLPGGVALDSTGDIFGTTYTDGPGGSGTVFEISAGSGAITTLASFDGSNGAGPQAGLIIDRNGNLFGTTSGGGANSDGTVFEIDGQTHALTTLITFDGDNGSDPEASLSLDRYGNLYGTAKTGGDSDLGTVFKIDNIGDAYNPTYSSALNTLISFDYDDGANPFGPLTLDDLGNLYGTTTNGDDIDGNVVGTVFKLSPVGEASAPEPGTLALFAPMCFYFLVRIKRKSNAPGVRVS